MILQHIFKDNQDMKKYTFLILLLIGLMQVEARLLDSWPRVVRNNSEVVFTLVLADEPILKEPEKLTLQYVQMDAVRANGKNYGRGYDKINFKINGNTITTDPIRIVGETEHTVRLVTPGPSGKLGKDAVVIAHHHVYAVDPDFFRLKPFRVNFHASSKLLGEQQPASAAHYLATLRQRGYDFVFFSSPDLAAAQKAIQDFPFKTDMKILPAEEVFIPSQSARLLALNPSESILNWFNANGKAAVEAELAKSAAAPSVVTTNVLVDAGRRANAFMVVEHPNDRMEGFPYLPKPEIDAILANRHYDAFEAIGGPRANLDIAQYFELCNRGPRVPAVGGTGLCPFSEISRNATIVLAESDSLDDIYAAVRACNAVPYFQPPQTYRRACCDLRRGRYTAFLIRYVFSIDHDRLCRFEGDAMLTILNPPKDGDAPDLKDKAAETLKNSSGFYGKWLEKYWAK